MGFRCERDPRLDECPLELGGASPLSQPPRGGGLWVPVGGVVGPLSASSQARNCSPGYMEQAPSRGHEASPQSRMGAGCKLCSSSKQLRGLSIRAHRGA